MNYIKRLGWIVFIALFILGCTTSDNIDHQIQAKIFKKKIKSNSVNSKVQQGSNKSEATKKSQQ